MNLFIATINLAVYLLREFLSYSSDQIKVDNGNLVISPTLKLKANALCQEIPLIWRKDRALNELVEKKKIPPEMYDDLHMTFEGALNQLKDNAKELTEEIDRQIDRCNKQILRHRVQQRFHLCDRWVLP